MRTVSCLGLLLVPAVCAAAPDTFGVGSGRTGSLTVSSEMTVNRYAQLVQPAPRGSLRLVVDAVGSFQAGALVMVHQVKASGVVPAPEADGHVDLRASGAGRFELARVEAIDGTALVLSAPLDRGFPALDSQVIFVPEYSDLTIHSGARLRAKVWDGASGGVVAFMVVGTLQLNNGAIDAIGAGFRGGVATADPAANDGCQAGQLAPPLGGMKGEGFGPMQLDAGGWAPSLAGGGGGDCLRAGGGGGSHVAAGGQGGYGASYDGGLNVGGRPGVRVAFDDFWHLTFGGGGGAGHSTGNLDAQGAPGGGVVFIRAGRIGGSGQYVVNGGNTPSSVQDGNGGGGAAGTVHLRSASTVDCLNIDASGGTAYGTSGRAGGGGGGATGRIFVQGLPGACAHSFYGGNCFGRLAADGGNQLHGCTGGGEVPGTWLMNAYSLDAGPLSDPWPSDVQGPTDGGPLAPRFVSEANPIAFCGAPYRYSTSRRPEVVGDRPLTFSLKGDVPAGATLDAATGELTWKPSSEQAGVHTFQLEVSGPGGVASQTVEVVVECAGDQPLRSGCACTSAPELGAVLAALVWLRRLRMLLRARQNSLS